MSFLRVSGFCLSETIASTLVYLKVYQVTADPMEILQLIPMCASLCTLDMSSTNFHQGKLTLSSPSLVKVNLGVVSQCLTLGSLPKLHHIWLVAGFGWLGEHRCGGTGAYYCCQEIQVVDHCPSLEYFNLCPNEGFSFRALQNCFETLHHHVSSSCFVEVPFVKCSVDPILALEVPLFIYTRDHIKEPFHPFSLFTKVPDCMYLVKTYFREYLERISLNSEKRGTPGGEGDQNRKIRFDYKHQKLEEGHFTFSNIKRSVIEELSWDDDNMFEVFGSRNPVDFGSRDLFCLMFFLEIFCIIDKICTNDLQSSFSSSSESTN